MFLAMDAQPNGSSGYWNGRSGELPCSPAALLRIENCKLEILNLAISDFQQLLHRIGQISNSERLGEKIRLRLLRGANDARFVRRAGEQENWCLIAFGANLFEKFHAVHPFQPIVRDDQVESLLLDQLQRFFSAFRLHNVFRAQCRHEARQCLERFEIVVNYQNPWNGTHVVAFVAAFAAFVIEAENLQSNASARAWTVS